MTTASYTGKIITDGYETVASKTEITFTSGNKYTLQVQGGAHLKVANAEFWVKDEKFEYTASDDDLYIQTDSLGCTLTILEG